jgi:integrase
MSKITGSYVDPNRSKLTVGALADQWLDAKLDLAPKTKDRYAQIIRAHVRPRWGKVRLSDVTHGEVQRWLARLEVAPATVRKTHRVLSMVLAYAVKDGRLAVNAAAGVSLPRVRQAEKRFLSHQQVAKLAEAVGPEYRLVVLFLAYTGLRWGEMAALRVHRVDFLRRRVLVAESVTPVRGKMTFGPTKGHERREVPLPRFLIDDLAQQVARKSRDEFVFTGERGAVMRSQTFQRAALTAAASELGIPGFHPHELRHTAASLAIASGADIKIVQTLLGHKSAAMTLDQYGHLFGDRLDVVADAMDAARLSALADGYPVGTRGEVVELRQETK